MAVWPVGDGQIRIEVSDEGLGLAPEIRDQLFSPFYRVASDETRGIQGTGLGLYIVKSMIESMDGSVDLESAVGMGSPFSIVLPAWTGDAPQAVDAPQAA